MERKTREWLEQVDSIAHEHDLSRDEDLAIALMHLISLEEHLFFTAMKTGDSSRRKMLTEIRDLRKRCLKKLVKNPRGEEWCISKHLLGASMRFMEAGIKDLSRGDDADEHFQAAYGLFSLFFTVNLSGRMAQEKDAQGEDAGSVRQKPEARSRLLKRAGDLLRLLVDCCRE